MRIAFVTTMPGSPWEGSEELWAAAAESALDEGHEVAASVYDWPTTPAKIRRLEEKGARIFRRSRRQMPDVSRALGRLLERPVRLPDLKRAVFGSPFKDVAHYRPDVVLVSQGATFEFNAPGFGDLLRWLESSSVPYVTVCQANSEWQMAGFAREDARRFFARAARVGFVSERNLEVAERQLAAALPNAVVVRNPVNLVQPNAVPWPASEEARMACVARLETHVKGQDVLFEALGSETWRKLDWRLSLFGRGEDREYLQDLAEHYGIAERVEFRGFVQGVRAIWEEHHLLVAPSRLEGTPLALVEAMLCGRPSVVTDVGGNAEWVEEGRSGFVAAAPTAKLLGAALERAWLAQTRWEHIGAAAHESAKLKFDPTPGKTLLDIVLEAARPVGLRARRGEVVVAAEGPQARGGDEAQGLRAKEV
jgi:glycosyltransferase involved in cell wall biosynthesis